MSSILLDTHVFIWLSEDDPTLPSSIRERIEATDDVFISMKAAAAPKPIAATIVEPDLNHCHH